jgi:hypothetical protein
MERPWRRLRGPNGRGTGLAILSISARSVGWRGAVGGVLLPGPGLRLARDGTMGGIPAFAMLRPLLVSGLCGAAAVVITGCGVLTRPAGEPGPTTPGASSPGAAPPGADRPEPPSPGPKSPGADTPGPIRPGERSPAADTPAPGRPERSGAGTAPSESQGSLRDTQPGPGETDHRPAGTDNGGGPAVGAGPATGERLWPPLKPPPPVLPVAPPPPP